jgi:lysophospholipase L1-like esterase
MNPLILQFANGNVFFIGLGMVVLSFVICLRRNGRLVKSLVTIGWLLGILFVILSATPLPLWIYGVWLAFCVTGFISLNLLAKRGSVLGCRRRIAAICVVLSLVLVFFELPYHLTPSVTVSPMQPVFVVGDSISAGIDSNERVWPEVLGDRTHLKVTNLSQAGASVGAALKQAARIDKTNSLVFIEIGGNDLLGGADIHTFHKQLEQLLEKVCAGGNEVVMFELPLFPFRNSFGAEQRSLAREYRVTLLPKRCLTRVFGMEGGTLDGLHLSQSGHDALAGEIQAMLEIKP